MSSSNAMGTRPVLPLLLSMSVPPMISMLIQSMYNVVDSIFVARLSQNALTAVSLAFPLQNLVLAVAVGLGVGLNACIARSLGAGDPEKANDAAAHGLVFTTIHALLFVLVGVFGTRPFLQMFTTDPEVLEMGCQYSYIVICLSFGSLYHIFIEKIFQATGNMVAPMILQGVGAIINIVLDPILIFGLFGLPAMGVPGAAIATVAGQMTACALAVALFVKGDCPVRIHMKGFRLKGAVAAQVYSVAVPSGLMVALPSLLVGMLNAILSAFSQTAVAVFGAYFKLQTFVYMPASGLVQGMRPIMSFNYGAGRRDRMHQILRSSLLVTGGIMLVGWLLFTLLPGPIMALFGADARMSAMGASALRIISLGFVVSTVGFVLAGAFEALGKGVQSLTVSMIRQLIVIPPLAWALSKPFGLAGVWASFPIAELLAAVVAVVLYRHTMKHLPIPAVQEEETK
ncbi:MATE family efflux transporter [Anaerofilum sp. An201]|nr:MATE family efflux transporter [Anaerofilum sp. An201]OUP05074.1 MATE family efflux transporter [Anaerofilum sp. An201]